MSAPKPKGRKAKAASATASARSVGSARAGPAAAVDRSLFDRFESYVGTLYDPESYNGELSPSSYPHQGASRLKYFDDSYVSSVANEIVVFKMYPRLWDTLESSVGGTTPAPSTNNTATVVFESTIAANTTTGGVGRTELVFGGPEGSQDFALTTSIDNVTGFSVNAFACATPAGVAMPFLLVNNGASAAQIRPYYYDPVTLTWGGMGGGFYPLAAGSSYSLASTFPNGASKFAVLYRNGSTEVRSVKLSVCFNMRNPSAAPLTLTYPSGGTSKFQAVLSDPQAIQEDIVRAMSIKLTCMGDLTTTAGRVACALVPRHWTPDPTNVIGSIAALPTGAYDGKLVDGGFITWQPREQQDFTFSPPEVDDDSHYIIMAAQLAHPDTPIRVKSTYVYEVFSLDPSLGSMAWCPSGFGLMEVLATVYAAVPVGSSNDGHKAKKKGALVAMRRLASKGIKWIMENPAEAAAMAAKAAAMVALV